MVSSYSCSDYGLFHRNTHWSLELLLKCCTLCQMSLLRFYKEYCFLVSTIYTWSLVLTCHQGILERLDAGEVIIGDGSYVNTLEKRGYVKVEILSRASIVVDAAATNTLTARGYTLCFHYCVLQRRATTRLRAVSSIHRQWSSWHKSEIFLSQSQLFWRNWVQHRRKNFFWLFWLWHYSMERNTFFSCCERFILCDITQVCTSRSRHHTDVHLLLKRRGRAWRM